ncbi:tripartite motif-containing 13 isoform X2 [Austrofundulus limnaeus]|uniref:E3 ubiquitin-protein ligase TRIM13 isoform X2 n=1 Tax=Austrofundulus limnaeus TaxID=52670 RepID=A0A2I4BHD7_AUSLI|nr:PREDICTED: E3 ubiquitin-protein ligase TRIM13 isoform X2 [Austrofundulus limnaeus]XP_013867154.1 PREDICTED: E3 ubiquitin-protein ligase TRIM13 isoform X2 [Austrofundulus limnaeus]
MEQLEEELTCPVCCGLFEDPRVLLCSHSFCKKCLEGLLDGLRAPRTPLKCPTCRKESPHNGANSLQINYSLRAIVEKFSKIKVPPKMSVCKQHYDQPCNIFCATDLRLICGFCATADEHGGHRFCSLEDAFELEKKASGMLIRQVESWRSADALSCLETLQANKKKTLQLVSEDAEKVADYFDKLVGALESKKSEILSDFETLRLEVMLAFDPKISQLRVALQEQQGALSIAQSMGSAPEPLVFLQQMQEFREKMKVLEETPLRSRKDALVGPLVRNFDVKKWDSLQLGEIDQISVPHESGAYRTSGSRKAGCRWVVLVLILFVALPLLLLHSAGCDDGSWMRAPFVTKLSSHTKEMTDMLMAAGQEYITNFIDSTVHFMSTFMSS